MLLPCGASRGPRATVAARPEVLAKTAADKLRGLALRLWQVMNCWDRSLSNSLRQMFSRLCQVEDADEHVALIFVESLIQRVHGRILGYSDLGQLRARQCLGSVCARRGQLLEDLLEG